MKGRRVRLLTVSGVVATTDVVVAADVPVGELRPVLVELVGGWRLPPEDPRWVLLTAGGIVLRPAATLHDQEVQDGEVLYLRTQPPARPLLTPTEEPQHEQPGPATGRPARLDARSG